jgi:hypothetical protein
MKRALLLISVAKILSASERCFKHSLRSIKNYKNEGEIPGKIVGANSRTVVTFTTFL